MSASYDPNHVTKLGELYSLVTGIWTKCKNLFATKSEVPSKTSDLQNDSGFITSSDIPAQQQANWNESDNTKPSFIQNKPSIPAAQVQSDWNQSDNTQVDFIKNKPSIPAAQVQSDWNQSDNTQVDFIKNKPTIPTTDQTYNASSTNPQSGTAVAGAIANVKQVPASTSSDSGKVLKVDASGNPEWGAAPASQVQADWTESDSSDPSYIQNKPVEQTLVAGTNVTITESNNQVTIGASFTQAQADWNQSDNTAADYIKNKPNIPAAQVQSDWSQSDNTQVDFIKNKPNSVPIAAGTGISATVSGGSLVIASDETVLWSGDSLQWNATELTLSESLFNFEKITVVYSPFSNVESQHMETFIPRNTTPYAIALSGAFLDSYNWTSSSTPYLYKDTFHWNAAGTKITLDMVWLQAHSGTTWSTRTDARMYKVIGINRKPAS